MRSGFGGAYNAPLCASEVVSCFLQQTCPIHFFRLKTKFLGGFMRFRCREVPVVRSGFRVHTMHHFVLLKLRLVFHNEHAQSTCLGPKLGFWVDSRDSVAGRYKL